MSFRNTCEFCGAPLTRDRGSVTTSKAAEMLSVSSATIRNWVDSGKLQSYRTVGNHRRILIRSIHEFLSKVHYPK